MPELVALLNGVVAGVVDQDRGGDLTFSYEQRWRDEPASYPLSLSMPLARRSHSDEVVRPFLEGLLPDNREVLERWGRRFQVSPRNAFALLRHMGQDCAGAVQFADPSRVGALLESPGSVEWLAEEQIAELLRDLTHRYGIGRFTEEGGQFSLAGAQPKTALLFENGKWGIPSGKIPSTHILKPPSQPHLPGFEINEHFCLNLASRLGIRVAASRIQLFCGEPAIVVERYDREVGKGGLVGRVHQEDVCQALARPPWARYENEGGPGASDIVRLLLRESNDPGTDVGTFLDAMVLNWVMVGSDAHAKNYSLILRPEAVRMAPLYDLVSALPFPLEIPYRKVKLAMRVDREYLAWKLRRRHWEGLASRCDLDHGPVLDRAKELMEAIPDAAQETAGQLLDEGLAEEIVVQIQGAITRHCHQCSTWIRSGA